MTTIKFKRLRPGKYEAQTSVGRVCICQSNADKKWYIDFPDGKRSYRSSYAGAKAWAEKYIARLESESVKVSAKTVKSEPAKTATTAKQETLKQRLSRSGAYVCGVEPIGCLNSGVNACVLHLIFLHYIYMSTRLGL
jgi:hypothetical protein